METDRKTTASELDTGRAWRQAFENDMPGMIKKREAAVDSLSNPNLDPAYRTKVISWIEGWDNYYQLHVDFSSYLTDQWMAEAAMRDSVDRITKGIGGIVLGLLITGGTYLLAKNTGVYFVTWGLVVWGAIQLIIGAVNIFQTKRKWADTRVAFYSRYPPSGR